jgi:8-oxo-dGTP pyrophosphatase MutT (NUDIX family)
MQQPPRVVHDLVAAIVPSDELERAHQYDALAWLESTHDIYRRAKPATPPKHLVSYAVLLDPRDSSVFLVDHILAGLVLPPGGHVEPGEHPASTARREAREELAIEADFSIAAGRPVFLTVTRTVGLDHGHTDVSLWYVISGSPQLPVVLDPREFTGGRWWTAAEIESADPALFDPHLGRFIAKIRSTIL